MHVDIEDMGLEPDVDSLKFITQSQVQQRLSTPLILIMMLTFTPSPEPTSSSCSSPVPKCQQTFSEYISSPHSTIRSKEE